MVNIPDSLREFDFRGGLQTVEVWTRRRILTFYALAVMRPKTCRANIAGTTSRPNATWMKQVSRNLTDCEDGILRNPNHLIALTVTAVFPVCGFIEQHSETDSHPAATKFY